MPLRELNGMRCDRFKRKVIRALLRWLSREPEATVDLVIENWLPGWNMDLSVNEAKECLNELVNSGILERYGIVFERPEKGPDEGLTGGKFHLI